MGDSSDQDGSRLDRELGELLQELRVTLPGVQVLFAFLLTLPFTQRFSQLTGRDQWIYFVALCSTAISAVLLMAPAAFHRLRFRRFDKDRLLKVSNRLLVSGMTTMGLAMVLVVFVVTDVLFESGWAFAIAGLLIVTIVTVWFVVPVLGSAHDRGVPASDAGTGSNATSN